MAQNHRLFLCPLSRTQNLEIPAHILYPIHNMIKIKYGSETKRGYTLQMSCIRASYYTHLYVPVIALHLMTTYIQILKSTTG